MTDKKIIFVGCDPGQSGGFVALDENRIVLDVFKTPPDRVSFINKMNELSRVGNLFLVKERVHSQPKHGGKANFTFGYNIGVLETCLTISKIPFQDITPQTWMKTFMLKKEKGETGSSWKNRIKNKAQELFPNQKVTLWNADAFMIAEFCRRTISVK